MSLANIRIVLVRPTHPGNVGATARAMKNMGMSRLCIVAPECAIGPAAVARAAGASDVLAQAMLCATLDEALADCRVVLGTSARSRRIEWPELDPPGGALRLVAAASQGPAALLFGQERTGLTNDDLDRCSAFVRIPTSDDYSSLNVASAVQILAYEVLRASHIGAMPVPRERIPVDHEQMFNFYRHLEQVLIEIGFLDPAKPRLLMRRLVRLFNRSSPDNNEINILRGILTAVQTHRALDNKTKE